MELNAIRDCEMVEVHTPNVISPIEAAMAVESEEGGWATLPPSAR